MSFPAGISPLYDQRTETFKVGSGRVPANVVYQMSQPAYPNGAYLEKASPMVPADIKPFLQIPKPPPASSETS